MILVRTLSGALYGSVVGFVWALSLNWDYQISLVCGAILGGICGLCFGIYQYKLEVKANRKLKEMSKAVNKLFFLNFIVGIILGFLVSAVKLFLIELPNT